MRTASGGTETCTVGSLASGGSTTCTIICTVAASTPDRTTLTTTSTFTATTPADNTTLSLHDALPIFNAQADLAIVKSAPATVIAGTTITYTLVVTNNGPSTASGVSEIGRAHV